MTRHPRLRTTGQRHINTMIDIADNMCLEVVQRWRGVAAAAGVVIDELIASRALS